ncbi:MAG: hypothetical protein E6J41_17340 [Chloroflexi bacterium]|nr:MAG: hypothetical protein E6J41_17340 [Chloroflexota bacterium]
MEAAVGLLSPGEPELRATALAHYERLAAEPTRRDPGAHVRAALLRALQTVALPEDVGMLEGATAVHEYLPPGPQEVAGGLRGAALVTLAQLDERLAGFHAARLIADPDPLTPSMSGEPALTAVRVLAAQDQLAALYGWLASAGPKAPEPVAEALRAMSVAPTSIVLDLVGRMGGSRDEVVLLGLFDLLLAAPEAERFEGFVLEFLRDTELKDLFGAIAATIIAGRRERLIQGLREVRSALAPEKARVLDELLA